MSWIKKIGRNIDPTYSKGLIGGAVEDGIRAGRKVGDAVGDLARGDLEGFAENLWDAGWDLTNAMTGGLLREGRDIIRDWLTPDIPPPDYESRKTMARNADAPRRVVYGETMVGGVVRYIESSGTDSATLHLIVIFAAHSCSEIKEVWFDGELAFVGTTAQGKYAGKATMIAETGKQTGANAQIVAQTPANWTTDHKLLGQTYAYFKLTYDRDAYSGSPNIMALIKGKDDIYDPRTGVTGWTDNHALIIRDFLLADYGYQLTGSDIDDTSFITGANISDQLVTAGTGKTEKRYTINGSFSIVDSPKPTLSALAAAGLATLQYVQGKVVYVPGIYTAPAATADFNEDDLWSGLQIVPTTGADERINGVRGTFVDPNQNYEVVDFVPIIVDAYVTQDKQELISDSKFPYSNSSTLARRLAKIIMERSRYGVRVDCKMGWRVMQYGVGDRIKLSVAGLGWSNKIFRIEAMEFGLEGAEVALQEDAPAVWQWDESDALAVQPPPALVLPATNAIPPPAALNLEQKLNLPRTQNQDLVTVTMDAGSSVDPRFGSWLYEYRESGIGAYWVQASQTRGSASVILAADGRSYEFSARPVSSNGRAYENRTTASLTVYNRSIQGAPEINTALPSIFGLRLVNNEGTGSQLAFKSGNAEFEWQPRSQVESVDFGWDEIGADQGQLDPHFDYYQISILSTNGRMLMQDKTRDPWYTLSLEDNKKHGIGREFIMQVAATGANAQQGEPERISVFNPASEAVTDVTVSYTSEDVTISYTRPADLDFVGVRYAGKLYTESSITLPPINARSVQISLTSVDVLGDGGIATVTLVNPAPPAVTGLSAEMGVGTATLNFTPPSSDYDYQGVTVRYRETGGVWSAPLTRTGSGAVINGLDDDTGYEFEVTTFDRLGSGGTATVSGTTRQIVAADVDGLGAWATLTDPADLQFIQDNMAADAIPSTRIESLVAGKIAAGAIAVQVDVGAGANSVLLDGASGIIRSVGGGGAISAYMGVHALGGVPYVFSASDGSVPVFGVRPDGSGVFGNLSLGSNGSLTSNEFSINADGSATFSGALSAATGTFSGALSAASGTIQNITATNITAQDIVISGTRRFTSWAPPVVTVGTGGDFSTINAALSYAIGFLGTGQTPSAPYKVGIRILPGFVINEEIAITGIDLSDIWLLFSDSSVTITSNQFLSGWSGAKLPIISTWAPGTSISFNRTSTGPGAVVRLFSGSSLEFRYNGQTELYNINVSLSSAGNNPAIMMDSKSSLASSGNITINSSSAGCVDIRGLSEMKCEILTVNSSSPSTFIATRSARISCYWFTFVGGGSAAGDGTAIIDAVQIRGTNTNMTNIILYPYTSIQSSVVIGAGMTRLATTPV